MQEKNTLPQNLPRQRQVPPQETIDLLEVCSLLLTHWWKIIIATLLGALLTLGIANARYSPTYSATAKLIINNSRINIGMTQVSVNAGDLTASQGLVSIYSEFLDSHLVLDATGEALAEKGYPGFNYKNLVGRITTRPVGSTPMIYLTVWDYDPETAIAIVNTLVETLPEQAGRVIEGSSVIPIDPAYSATLRPNNIRTRVLQGAAIGFALSAALIVLYYYMLNDMIEQQEWFLDNYPALPQLGCVPDTVAAVGGSYGYGTYGEAVRKKKKPKKNTQADFGENLSFFGTEAYNAIRTNIKFSFHGKKTGHIIGVTSALVGDGKTYTSVNLAYAMAKDNSRVLLIDGDMRKLTLREFFDDPADFGLSEVLCGVADLESTICPNRLHENMSVLFSGSMPPNPSELLGSEEMQQLLERLRSQYDYVLIDLPPIGSVTDATAVSGFLDGMILVVRHDHTRKKHIRNTIRQLELSNVRMLGFIYNANVERYSLYKRYYSRYYSSYYQKEYKK